jgi:hypothetical protein
MINREHGFVFLFSFLFHYLYGIDIQIDEDSPDEDERKAMQVIQDDRHDGLNHTYFVPLFHCAYTQTDIEIDEDSPDEDDRKAMLVIQGRHSGLIYLFLFSNRK